MLNTISRLSSRKGYHSEAFFAEESSLSSTNSIVFPLPLLSCPQNRVLKTLECVQCMPLLYLRSQASEGARQIADAFSTRASFDSTFIPSCVFLPASHSLRPSEGTRPEEAAGSCFFWARGSPKWRVCAAGEVVVDFLTLTGVLLVLLASLGAVGLVILVPFKACLVPARYRLLDRRTRAWTLFWICLPWVKCWQSLFPVGALDSASLARVLLRR